MFGSGARNFLSAHFLSFQNDNCHKAGKEVHIQQSTSMKIEMYCFAGKKIRQFLRGLFGLYPSCLTDRVTVQFNATAVMHQFQVITTVKPLKLTQVG